MIIYLKNWNGNPTTFNKDAESATTNDIKGSIIHHGCLTINGFKITTDEFGHLNIYSEIADTLNVDTKVANCITLSVTKTNVKNRTNNKRKRSNRRVKG